MSNKPVSPLSNDEVEFLRGLMWFGAWCRMAVIFAGFLLAIYALVKLVVCPLMGDC